MQCYRLNWDNGVTNCIYSTSKHIDKLLHSWAWPWLTQAETPVQAAQCGSPSQGRSTGVWNDVSYAFHRHPILDALDLAPTGHNVTYIWSNISLYYKWFNSLIMMKGKLEFYWILNIEFSHKLENTLFIYCSVNVVTQSPLHSTNTNRSLSVLIVWKLASRIFYVS